MKSWVQLCFRWPRLVCCVVLAVSIIPISQLPFVEIQTNIESILHPNDPIMVTYNKFRREFGRDGQIYLGIETESIFDAEFLADLRRLHADIENDVPLVKDVTSMVDARLTRGEDSELVVEGLLDGMKQGSATLEETRARALDNPLYLDLLFTEDERYTAVSIQLYNTTSGDDWEKTSPWAAEADQPDPVTGKNSSDFLSGEDMRRVVDALYEVLARYEGPKFKVYAVGQPVIVTTVNDIMRADVARFLGIAVLLSAGVLFLLFRRPAAAILPLVTVFLSILSTIGLMAGTGTPLQTPTQVLPVFLLCVGICCCLHVLVIFYQNLARGTRKQLAMEAALVLTGPPLMMTTATTAAALAAFITSPLMMVSNLGIFAPIGVILSLFYTLSLLPALIALAPIREDSALAQSPVASLQRAMISLALSSAKHPRIVLSLAAVVLVVGMAGFARTTFSYYMLHWLQEHERPRIDAERFDEVLNGAQVLEVLFDTGRENGLHDPGLLAGLDRIHSYNESLTDGQIFIGKTTSIVDVLKETHRALNENRASHYRIPDSQDLISQELLLFESTGTDDLEDFVDPGFRVGRMTLKIPWVDAAFYPPFIQSLEEKYASILGSEVDVTVTGIAALESRGIMALTESLAESYLIAFSVIAPMMILFLGNVRWGLASMLPNLIPIGLAMGLLGWLEVPLDAFTLLTGSIVLGLAVDDTIHIMLGFRRNYARTGEVQKAVQLTLETTGQAVFFTTLILAAGFLLFVFGRMVAIYHFGLITGFAIGVALIADVTVGPALLALLVRGDQEPTRPRRRPRSA